MVEAKAKKLESGEIENHIIIEGMGETILLESISLIIALLDSLKNEDEELYADTIAAVIRIAIEASQDKAIQKKERLN